MPASATSITHLGHTSFAIERDGHKVLIDPIVAREDLEFRRPTSPHWFYGDLAGVDAIFISHGHNDHLHPPSLLGFPPEVPIYFLNEDPATCSCDEDPRVLLPNLGFQDIRPFDPGDVVEVGGDIRIHIVAAENSSEGEEQCCFLVETPDVSMLDAVDIRDSRVTREALEPHRGRVDLAFVPTGAALQWQGFWNQMDSIEALGFCQWLDPKRVATCGGSLSLSERERTGTLERYPKDLADWLSTATDQLELDRLVRRRPPFVLEYRQGELSRLNHLNPLARYQPANGSQQARSVVTTFFTGYDPKLPTQRLTWVDSGLKSWLDALAPVREVFSHSQRELHYLVERCDPSVNQTPAGILLPRTLHALGRGGATELMARLSTLCPPAPEGPEELERTFFAVAESIVESAPSLGDCSLRRLRACLWIDRRFYQLRNVHIRLRNLSSFPLNEARQLLDRHIADLRRNLGERRPVLGPNHFRLDAEQAALMDPEAPADTAGLICYAAPSGVRYQFLSEIEGYLLDQCDGRTFAEITAAVGDTFEMPQDQVSEALFGLLAGLTRASVILVDWSS